MDGDDAGGVCCQRFRNRQATTGQDAAHARRGHEVSWLIVGEQVVIGRVALIDDDGVLAVRELGSADAGNLGDAGIGVTGFSFKRAG